MDLHDYKDVAENYDYYLDELGGTYEGFEAFYLELAKKYGQNGLVDIACGAGALTLPFARAGYDVTAIDLSEAMVEVTKKKLRAEGLEVNAVAGNMIDFSIARKFSFAVIARSGFMHLLTYEDQEKALLNIRDHLVDGGVLTLNTFEPSYEMQLSQMHSDINDFRHRTDFINGKGLKKLYHAMNYNPETQIMRGQWKFETYDDKGELVDVRIRDLAMRQSYSIQIHYLAEKCGYTVVEAVERPECNNNIVWILKNIKKR